MKTDEKGWGFGRRFSTLLKPIHQNCRLTRANDSSRVRSRNGESEEGGVVGIGLGVAR